MLKILSHACWAPIWSHYHGPFVCERGRCRPKSANLGHNVARLDPQPPRNILEPSLCGQRANFLGSRTSSAVPETTRQGQNRAKTLPNFLTIGRPGAGKGNEIHSMSTNGLPCYKTIQNILDVDGSSGIDLGGLSWAIFT